MTADPHGLTVADIGELGLLERLQAFCPSNLVGDDAAVVQVETHQQVVLTTDVLVDGVHFSDRTTGAEDVGWRATAANLSDLAAMGAIPIGITVGLSLPGETAVAWVESVYRGMAACLTEHGGVVLGGDICRSSVITLAITAMGQVHPQQVLRRDQARPGQKIVMTGFHGASRAGFELLVNADAGQNLSDRDRTRLIQAHRRPVPRFDAVHCLWDVVSHSDSQAMDSSAIAAMDSSDGLANAVLQLCQASGVGAIIDRAAIPLPPGFRGWISPQQGMDWALYGGEDFELVACLEADLAQAWVDRLGAGAAVIGEISRDRAVILQDSTGEHPDVQLGLQQGFQHF